jgi:thiol:disulfide interchange protein
MQPIVNGLEAEFSSRIVFEDLAASLPAGRDIMKSYSLRGHPSYVIFGPNGTPLWSYSGAVAADVLATQIEQSLRPLN